MIASGEHGVEKPDPRLFELAMNDLGTTPDRCIYIGDNPHNDIVPAEMLGMRAIHFNPRGDSARADVRYIGGLRKKLHDRGLL